MTRREHIVAATSNYYESRRRADYAAALANFDPNALMILICPHSGEKELFGKQNIYKHFGFWGENYKTADIAPDIVAGDRSSFVTWRGALRDYKDAEFNQVEVRNTISFVKGMIVEIIETYSVISSDHAQILGNRGNMHDRSQDSYISCEAVDHWKKRSQLSVIKFSCEVVVR